MRTEILKLMSRIQSTTLTKDEPSQFKFYVVCKLRVTLLDAMTVFLVMLEENKRVGVIWSTHNRPSFWFWNATVPEFEENIRLLYAFVLFEKS